VFPKTKRSPEGSAVVTELCPNRHRYSAHRTREMRDDRGREMKRLPAHGEVKRLPLAQFSCTGCGYGASRPIAPERCPMCGGSAWENQPWRPFSSSDRRGAGAANGIELPSSSENETAAA
jgi:hypothetical protein